MNRIHHEAAHWSVELLDENFDGTQADRFARWLSESPEHLQAFASMQQTWDRSGQLNIPAPVERGQQEGSVGIRTVVFDVLAAAAVAAVAWLLINIGSPAAQVVKADTGVPKHIVLPDGSQAKLRASTEMVVKFGSEQREITLSRGEAQFDVVHDARRPFSVKFADSVAWDLGTRFSIRLRGEHEADLIVQEGRVCLGRDLQHCEIEVAAGEDAHLDFGVWKVNTWLTFWGAPLSEFVAEINRHNQRKLQIADPTIADISVGAIIQSGDLDTIKILLRKNRVRIKASGNPDVLLLVRDPGHLP